MSRAVVTIHREAAEPKGFGAQFLDGVYDEFMLALQCATRDCIDSAAKQFEDEFSLLQKKHKEEVESLRVELQELSARHQVLVYRHAKYEQQEAKEESASKESTSDQTPAKICCVGKEVDDRTAAQSSAPQDKVKRESMPNASCEGDVSPAQISILMTPNSCSTSSASQQSADKSGTIGNFVNASPQALPSTHHDGPPLAQACGNACEAPHDRSSKNKNSCQQTKDFVDSVSPKVAKEENKTPSNLDAPADMSMKASLPLPIQPTPPTPHHNQTSRKAKCDSNALSTHELAHTRTLKTFHESDEGLEPDTIEVLRAALVDDSLVEGCTPKMNKGTVMLPPAAVHGRSNATENGFPTPQSSPLARLAFETPRGSSPRQPVRTPRLSHIFSTPGAGSQTPASANDTLGCIASPPSKPCEMKSRRLSWPISPKIRAAVGKMKESNNLEDEDNANDGGQSAARFLAVAQPAAASPKDQTEVDRERGSLDPPAVQVVASPLRRRWLGVFNAVGGSTSAAVARPPHRM
mmetsp:Transcript_96177/g.152129  ORF Transcript_96177/g.152129 Transcript_96177/m.152129 type:complete len:522 (+) Transcript_96177:100-1665(+)